MFAGGHPSRPRGRARLPGCCFCAPPPPVPPPPRRVAARKRIGSVGLFFFFPNRDRLKGTEGKIGHFWVRTHLSELTNGANLTESERNGLHVKKICPMDWTSNINFQWLGCPIHLFFNELYVKGSWLQAQQRNFLYLFCHDSKNKWSNQNFREMYIYRRGARR
jgi:hypothetical protein